MTAAIRAYARANQGTVIVPFHPGRRDGPGDHRRGDRPGPCGDAGRLRPQPAGPARRADHLRQLPVRPWRCSRAPPPSARRSRRSARSSSASWPGAPACPLRCAGNFTTSKRPDAQAMTEGAMSIDVGDPQRRQFLPPFRRLPGRPAVHVLREVHHGRGPVRRPAHLFSPASRSTRRRWRWTPSTRSARVPISSAAAIRCGTTGPPSGDPRSPTADPFETWSENGAEDAATPREPPLEGDAVMATSRRRSTRVCSEAAPRFRRRAGKRRCRDAWY